MSGDRRRTYRLPDGSSELDVIAAEAKVGTEHALHDGWTWAHPDRVLRCGCGGLLVAGRDPDRLRE